MDPDNTQDLQTNKKTTILYYYYYTDLAFSGWARDCLMVFIFCSERALIISSAPCFDSSRHRASPTSNKEGEMRRDVELKNKLLPHFQKRLQWPTRLCLRSIVVPDSWTSTWGRSLSARYAPTCRSGRRPRQSQQSPAPRKEAATTSQPPSPPNPSERSYHHHPFSL